MALTVNIVCFLLNQKVVRIISHLVSFAQKLFNKWKHTVERFNNHEKANYLQNSVIDFQSVSAIVIGKSDQFTYHQLNKAVKSQKENNRKIIFPVIDSVLLCGRQGIVQGHSDSGVLKLEYPIIIEG